MAPQPASQEQSELGGRRNRRLRQSKGRNMGGAMEEERGVPGGRIRVDLMEGALGLGVPSWVKQSAEGTGWGRVEGAWETDGPPGGWRRGGRGTPPWKERGKGAGKEGVAGTGWVGRGGGVRRGRGGVCPGLLSCHPHPRPGATCAPPYRPHPSWGTTEPGVRASCVPRGSSRVLLLPGRLS